jgi:hypothetical protein
MSMLVPGFVPMPDSRVGRLDDTSLPKVSVGLDVVVHGEAVSSEKMRQRGIYKCGRPFSEAGVKDGLNEYLRDRKFSLAKMFDVPENRRRGIGDRRAELSREKFGNLGKVVVG